MDGGFDFVRNDQTKIGLWQEKSFALNKKPFIRRLHLHWTRRADRAIHGVVNAFRSGADSLAFTGPRKGFHPKLFKENLALAERATFRARQQILCLILQWRIVRFGEPKFADDDSSLLTVRNDRQQHGGSKQPADESLSPDLNCAMRHSPGG